MPARLHHHCCDSAPRDKLPVCHAACTRMGGLSGSSAPWLDENHPKTVPVHVPEKREQGVVPVLSKIGAATLTRYPLTVADHCTSQSMCFGGPLQERPRPSTADPLDSEHRAARLSHAPTWPLAVAPTPLPHQKQRLHSCGAACDLAHGWSVVVIWASRSSQLARRGSFETESLLQPSWRLQAP